MNEFLQAVVDYVRTPRTDYALLITGPWGCGKTYFWKHVVESHVRQMSCAGGEFHPLYASLYGCQSVTEIDTQLFLASYPHLKDKWKKRLAAVGGNVLTQLVRAFTGLELPAINLRWLVNTKNAVLCFDDLERTRLPMKEALGYINTFVEHEGAKVIILCNEAAIEQAEQETYRAMKEKIVGASLDFRPDLDEVFRTLIAEFQSRAAFHGFLLKNAGLLRRLFDRSETHNIRSLRRALSALAVIFDALAGAGMDPNTVGKQLIYVVTPASFELHGRAVDPLKLREILCEDNMAIAGWGAMSRKKEGRNEDDFVAAFAERYFAGIGLGEWKDVVGCIPIYKFLVTGILDRAGLVSWARELTKPVDEREERFKRLTLDPYEMEDTQFTAAAARTMEEVETGQVDSIGGYWGLYRVFEWFCDSGLIALTRQELLQKFRHGLEKALQNGKLKPEPRLRYAFDQPGVAPTTDEGRSLCQRLREVNEALLRGAFRERVKTLATRFQSDPEGFIHALAAEDENGWAWTPVFQELPVAALAEQVIGLPNSLKQRFDWALQARYEKRPLSAEFAVELSALTELRHSLSKHVEARNVSPVPMSLYLIQSIVRTLDRAMERLKQVVPNKAAAVAGTADVEPDPGDDGDGSS